MLVLNVGSSTLKVALFAADPAQPDAPPRRLWEASTARSGELIPQLQNWLEPQLQPWWPQIQLAGHRLVHGGERFVAPTRLDRPVLEELEALNPLAPLHNPLAREAIRWLGALRPGLPQWACFDTAFHSTLPLEASTYALPAAWRQRGYRRYGFHGINHQHVAEALPCGRLISAHLGAGCSLAAVHNGRSIDTTMGFTPLEGLVMASRCGSVDPGLLLHQLRRGLSVEELDQALNRRSGLLALSQLSGSMQELRAAATAGHEGAQLAIAVFRHRLLREIGAMAASLGGVDVLAFTGGIGEHDDALREEVVSARSWLSPFEVMVIAADEEQVIARACRGRMNAEPGGNGH